MYFVKETYATTDGSKNGRMGLKAQKEVNLYVSYNLSEITFKQYMKVNVPKIAFKETMKKQVKVYDSYNFTIEYYVGGFSNIYEPDGTIYVFTETFDILVYDLEEIRLDAEMEYMDAEYSFQTVINLNKKNKEIISGAVKTVDNEEYIDLDVDTLRNVLSNQLLDVFSSRNYIKHSELFKDNE